MIKRIDFVEYFLIGYIKKDKYNMRTSITL